MKEITYELLHHLKTFPKIPNAGYSSNADKFLHIIFQLIIESQTVFLSSPINKTHPVLTNENVSSYIPIEIKTYIQQNNKSKTLVSFKIKTREITLHLYHFNNIHASLLNQHIKRIFMWLYVAFHFANEKCSQRIKINIFFTDKEKMLPKKSREVLSSIHANTAFTTSCKPETEINIFREEEWFKVLIHETFHCLGLDFSETNTNRSNLLILQTFPVMSDVRLFETYCEVWAETMNCIFVSFLSTKRNGIAKMIEKTKKLLYCERQFSLFQLQKIIRHFHLKYEELHSSDREISKKRNNHYKEETPILSYYILKCIYLFYHNEFLDWCIQHNGYSLNFKKTNKTIESYANFIQRHYNKPDFLEAVHQFSLLSMRGPLSKTMRMTVFELL